MVEGLVTGAFGWGGVRACIRLRSPFQACTGFRV